MARLLKWRSPTIIEMEDDVNNREEKFPPVHPGEILLEDFLKPMEITPYRLAKELRSKMGSPIERHPLKGSGQE
jgi:hypothetical protein